MKAEVEERELTMKEFVISAKLQAIGKDQRGRDKFMVYVTPIARKKGWKKGDTLRVGLSKLQDTHIQGSGGVDNSKPISTSQPPVPSTTKSYEEYIGGD